VVFPRYSVSYKRTHANRKTDSDGDGEADGQTDGRTACPLMDVASVSQNDVTLSS